MNIDIITSIKNFFSKKPEIDIVVDNEEIPKITGELI